MKIAIGIDVGGTNTKYGVLTENGKLIKKTVHANRLHEWRKALYGRDRENSFSYRGSA